MNGKLWEPDEEILRSANIVKFMNYLRYNTGIEFDSYEELWNWSVDSREDFWRSLWEYTHPIFSKPPENILENKEDMLNSKWFSGAELNFTENLLRFRDDREAIIFRSENTDLPTRRITYRKLYDEVEKVAHSLRESGVMAGDRVAGFMPNIIETVVVMLASVSLGAIWSSCSPDFGFQGVIDRFGQIKPKVLFTADGYFYNGKTYDSIGRVEELLKELPSIEKVVVIPFVDEKPPIEGLDRGVLYGDFLPEKARPLEFEKLPFDHPLYILFTSGTTGVPKCMVHGAGGTLLQHAKELILHTDLSRSDKIFYFTTCGWMMWNWLVSALFVGSTVMLFDGSPFHPDPTVLWKYTEREGITVFGTSAKYLTALEKEGVKPGRDFDLSKLRSVLSTGSPLSLDSFRFVYRDIKEDLVLSSISGGSDIISCFALGNPILPVWIGELQCRGLGMKVDVFDENGDPLRGEPGELVCTRSFPSQPIYFWNDPGKVKYKRAYFETYPNVWHHGDYAEITEHNGLIIYGRSDATLNPGGVRIGTAEIYRPVESLPEIADSLVIGQRWEDDIRIVLFVKMKEGRELNEDLIRRIRSTIKEQATPRHIPSKIIRISDIPYTISGKKVELAVTRLIHGKEVYNRDALKNPDSLDLYKDLPELMDK